MKEIQTHELTREQLTELADMISDKVIKHQDGKRKRLKDNAYHNTRLLLRNYDKLKKHCEIVDEQTVEDLGTLWSDWRFDINSLLEHKAKTAKLMRHVDKALIALKAINEDDYKLIKRKYLTPNVLTDDIEIAIEFGIDRTTVVRRLKKSCEELSILLFGIDVIILNDK